MSDQTSASSASTPQGGAGSTKAASKPSAGAGGAAAGAASDAAPKQNPALKMMGIPNFRFRLPSRNWLIFLSITGSFTAAVLYDKREKRRAQEKWAALVSPLKDQIMQPNQLPRKIKIYVQAPPGDGLTPARELFHEYVKPILVAGGLEWEVVEGRREGDIRWGVAEGIRKERRRKGEGEAEEEEDLVAALRQRVGTKEWDGVGGELVIGRHTWKEFIRGLHEGWLGPVNKPKEALPEISPGPIASQELPAMSAQSGVVSDGNAGDGHSFSSVSNAAVQTVAGVAESTVESLESVVDNVESLASQTNATPAVAPEEVKEKEKTDEEKAEEERKKRLKPGPYNSTSDYPVSSIPRSMPEQLGPTTVLPFPHLIGFTYTPRRLWRFLHRRYLADDIGRQVAALVIGAQFRTFETHIQSAEETKSPAASGEEFSVNGQDQSPRREWEHQKLLAHEENEWYKSVKKREKVEGQEDIWKDPLAIDERIADRMRIFELATEDEAKAARIAKGESPSTES